MPSTRLMRLALALVFAAGLAAIVWSLLSRQPSEDPPEEQPLLEPDVESQSTAFEYAEKRQGRTIFRVAADKSVQTRDGRQRMEDVLLELYDEQGEVSDTVRGRRALYRVGESNVEFTEDVEIRLLDGTLIRSDQVRADLEAEVVLIDQDFQLRRGRVSGRGQRLRYQIGPRVARMLRFQAEIPEGGDRILVQAQEAVYDLSEEYVELRGRASLRREPSLLSAERIEVWMTRRRRVRRLLSQDSARFAPDPSQAFAGARIEHRFDPSSGGLTGLEVRSAPQRARGQPGRAVYEQAAPGGAQRLEADLIAARPAAGVSSGDFALGEMKASGQVRFTSPRLSIERADSQRFEIAFGPDGRSIRRVDLADEVSMVRRDGQTAGSESLESPAAALVLGPGESLESVSAEGPALLKVNRPEVDRRLNAQGGLRFAFSQGRLESMLARGGCRLQSREGQEASLLEAPRIEVQFRQGRPLSAWAGEKVHLTMGPRDTRSRTLRLDYRQGLLARAVQEGDFRMDDSQRGVALEAHKATYDPATQLVSAGGPGRHRLIYRDPSREQSRPVVTLAQEYLLDRSGGGITAQGEVGSRIEKAQGEWTLEAQKMQLDETGRAIAYSGNPVLRSGESEVRGRLIRLSTGDDSLLVEGNVYSRFQAGEPASAGEGRQPRRYEVRSRTLRLEPSSGLARYRGQVRLESEDLEVDAPSMDVLQGEQPGPQGQASLSRIEAWDQVEARLPQSGRRALGKRLVYDPRTGEAEMTGNPVRLFKPDPKTGKMSKLEGRKLIFKVGSDSLRLLSSEQTATERP